MKLSRAFLSFALLAAQSALAEIQTDWAYHAVGDSSPWAEPVPGEDLKFLANGTDQVGNADTVTLHVLTARGFAGNMDEQIYVRWWDGTMSHWIMGSWIKNIVLDASRPETRLRGQPSNETVTLDLWRIEIPPWITQPGENFYAIQLKGYADGSTEERYLLSKPGGDFCQTNNLGQIWSASEEFDGQDWVVHIVE